MTNGDMFDELLNFLENNLHRNILLDEMADVCGLSTSHFRAVFRKRFCQSPGHFFRQLRMNMAAQKLRETTLPVKEIARQSGFDMLSNFYRAFYSVYRLTPVEYRSRNMPKG